MTTRPAGTVQASHCPRHPCVQRLMRRSGPCSSMPLVDGRTERDAGEWSSRLSRSLTSPPWPVALSAARRCPRRCCRYRNRPSMPPLRTSRLTVRTAESPGQNCRAGPVPRQRPPMSRHWVLRSRCPRRRISKHRARSQHSPRHQRNPHHRRPSPPPTTRLLRVSRKRRPRQSHPRRTGVGARRPSCLMATRGPNRPASALTTTRRPASGPTTVRRGHWPPQQSRRRVTEHRASPCRASSRRARRSGAYALVPARSCAGDARLRVVRPGLQPAHVRHRGRCAPIG